MRIYKTERFIGKGQSIGIFSGTSMHEEAHIHEFIEIIYAKSGEAVETVDGVDYSVKRGDMIFINYGSTHAFKRAGDKKYEYVNICFSPEVVANNIITPENAFSLLSLTAFNEMSRGARGEKLSFFGTERQEIENILEAMLREKKEKRPSADKILESYMNIIITKMLRKTSLQVDNEELDDVWRALSDYIDENLDTKLTLSLLASKCFYNPSYFSRTFKEKFGMTLTEYINRKRVASASKLLLESDMSVDEISERVGFSDRSSFYHTFSKIMGTTPSEYRGKNLLNVKISDK
jgi:AraC-like DNA-binding protein/quercetin dioxygenase-like cupin family protein